MRNIEKQIRKNFEFEVGLTGEHPATILISDNSGVSTVSESDAFEALLRPDVRGLAIIGDVDGKPAIRFFWVQRE